MNPAEIKISIHQKIAFFQTFQKNLPGFSLWVANTVSPIFAPLFLQVKYKTSEMKQTYLHNKIFGGLTLFLKLYQNVNF